MYGIITMKSPHIIIYYYFWQQALGFELRTSQPLCQPFLVMGFFKIGSLGLFVWAGFET
jgi:hypothetical protein